MKIHSMMPNDTLVSPTPCKNNDKTALTSSFAKTLAEIEKGERFIDRVINSSINGRDFTPEQLIAIQAGVYKYTQRLEIFSKLVETTSSSIKQILNS